MSTVATIATARSAQSAKDPEASVTTSVAARLFERPELKEVSSDIKSFNRVFTESALRVDRTRHNNDLATVGHTANDRFIAAFNARAFEDRFRNPGPEVDPESGQMALPLSRLHILPPITATSERIDDAFQNLGDEVFAALHKNPDLRLWEAFKNQVEATLAAPRSEYRSSPGPKYSTTYDI